MSKIIALAPSGFGKSMSIGKSEKLGHIGLDPKTTYLISVTSKPLPFQGSASQFKVTTPDKITAGNRIISNQAEVIANAILALAKSPMKVIVIDDFNYIMQDYYMENAKKGGWETPKNIGYQMGKIFDAMEKIRQDQHLIVLAHGEAVISQDGRTYFKLKTTGKMVDEYITPEGKFDVTLVGQSRFDSVTKTVVKEYLTNESEFISSAKSPYGMFEELYIPNDLGYVIQKIDEYYNG